MSEPTERPAPRIPLTPVQCFLSDLSLIAACQPRTVAIYTDEIQRALEDSGLRAEINAALVERSA